MSSDYAYQQFMAVCHPNIPTHIKRKNKAGEWRKVPNPSYYSGVLRQQFKIAEKFATSSLDQFQGALTDANARLDTANAKIEELNERVKSLEKKRDQTRNILAEAHSVIQHDIETMTSLRQHISALEKNKEIVASRIDDWRATLGSPCENERTQVFTEEWHVGTEGKVYFINPKTEEVMDPSIETHPIIGIRRGDVESGFTLVPVQRPV